MARACVLVEAAFTARPSWFGGINPSLTCHVNFASPKSRIFAWPRVVTKMFAGLISRWMMPLACAASSPRQSGSPSREVVKPEGGTRMRNWNWKLQTCRWADFRVSSFQFVLFRVPQRLPFQQFHGHEGLAAVLVHIVDRADMRVIERRGGTAPPAGSAASAVEFSAKPVRQEFQGDKARPKLVSCAL